MSAIGDKAGNAGAVASGRVAGGYEPAPTISLASNIAARIERLPLTRWQIFIRLTIGLVTFFDAFDMLMISYVLPVISRQWQLTAGTATWAIVAGSAGMLVGAVSLGWLADRFGRVKMIALALVVYSLASLALALAPTFGVFVALRFVQGVGIGGEVPIAATYINELVNARRRGRFVLSYEAIFPLGVAIHGLVATFVIPTLGWRWLFVIGALPLPMLFIIRRFVPESPRWLASRGQAAKALETIDRIEKSVQRYSRSPLPQPDFSNHMRAAAMQRGSRREIFKGIYCRRTLNLWAIWFTLSFVHFGISNWLPTIYREVFHLPLRTALAYAAINPWFAVAGALFVALIIDRLGRRWTLSVALACVGGILIVLSLAGAQPLSFLIACCALLAFVATIIITGLYVYIPELYPTRVRGLGASSAGVWSRLGAIAGPATFGVLLHWNYSLPTIFMLLGIVGVIGGVAALLFSEETSGRVLEELSP